MLQRAVYVSDAVGTAGGSLLSIAQILGVSDVNNRRDRVTGALMAHGGQFMQVIEGARGDIDRLLLRLRADPRHENMRILLDGPAQGRVFDEPMIQSPMDETLRDEIGDRALSDLSLPQAEALLLAGVERLRDAA